MWKHFETHMAGKIDREKSATLRQLHKAVGSRRDLGFV